MYIVSLDLKITLYFFQEWSDCPHEFLGAYKLEYDMSWTPVEKIEQRNQELAMIDNVLNTQLFQAAITNWIYMYKICVFLRFLFVYNINFKWYHFLKFFFQLSLKKLLAGVDQEHFMHLVVLTSYYKYNL